MTSNCIVPPGKTYLDRIYTTSSVGFDGVTHLVGKDGQKDFSAIIEQAKKCEPPVQLEEGTIMGGFADNARTTSRKAAEGFLPAGPVSVLFCR